MIVILEQVLVTLDDTYAHTYITNAVNINPNLFLALSAVCCNVACFLLLSSSIHHQPPLLPLFPTLSQQPSLLLLRYLFATADISLNSAHGIVSLTLGYLLIHNDNKSDTI